MILALSWPVAAIWISVSAAIGATCWALFRSPANMASLMSNVDYDDLETGQRMIGESLQGVHAELQQIKAQLDDLQRVLKQVE